MAAVNYDTREEVPMNIIPFNALSSAEQLERAQYLRDGGAADLEALADRDLAGINIFADTRRSSATALHDTESARRLAKLMRDWGR